MIPRTLETFLTQAKRRPPLTVAVVDAADRVVLESVRLLLEEKIMNPILVGEEKKIRTMLSEEGIREEVPIVPAGSEDEAAREGSRLVEEGTAQILMKGHLHSDVFLHPILERLRTGHRLSHVFVAELPSYKKLLFITDAAINIAPDLATKAAILQNAIDMVLSLGGSSPHAAILSAVELVNPAIISTVEAAALAKMADRGQIRGATVDGPLAFDNAISREAAHAKGIDSPVSGKADILLVPDIISGNILAKDLEYLAGATLAGVVLGARVPIILTSRSDPPRSRLLSAALATLLWRSWNPERGS
ncbi:MAG: bifunctional enoyl-CoA hydratase/phosphate acetyltransferase [Leptospirillia bacterium]